MNCIPREIEILRLAILTFIILASCGKKTETNTLGGSRQNPSNLPVDPIVSNTPQQTTPTITTSSPAVIIDQEKSLISRIILTENGPELPPPVETDEEVNPLIVDALDQTIAQTLALASFDASLKPLTPRLLLISYARSIKLPNWNPPRICSEQELNATPNCSDVSANVSDNYCKEATKQLNKLYCTLGGDSRENSSYVGHITTTGDLVAIHQFALNVCAISEPEGGFTVSSLAKGISIFLNQTKSDIAAKLVQNFLDYKQGSNDYEAELEFLKTDILRQDIYRANATDALALQQDFGAACLYLIEHPRQTYY